MQTTELCRSVNHLKTDKTTKDLKLSYGQSHLRLVVIILVNIWLQLVQHFGQFFIRMSLNRQCFCHRKYLSKTTNSAHQTQLQVHEFQTKKVTKKLIDHTMKYTQTILIEIKS